MNLFRAVAAISSTRRSFLRPFLLSHSSYLATRPVRERSAPKPNSIGSRDPKTTAPAADVPRPAEIPWQPTIYNSVHLLGSVEAPVQIDVAPDGQYWAASFLKQEKTATFPGLWIPIVFEGDLAQNAVVHLKENDIIYLSGQMSGAPSSLPIDPTKTYIQVLVHDFNVVNQSHPLKKPRDQNVLKPKHSGNTQENIDDMGDLWQDLLTNPKNWSDHRQDKKNGLLKPTYPDFKHKSGQALWLNRAPEEILLELENMDLGSKDSCKKQESNKHDSTQQQQESNKHDSTQKKMIDVDAAWKDLLENPGNWWDNREGKSNPRSPDFKHKRTGASLWIDTKSTPVWVQANLPPVKPKQNVSSRGGKVQRS